ncbi:MAG: ABC transporter permease [Gammaproteobacteria bacterium]|nr:ABC transporter permease [Gammaproteobacteria bacterium]
MHPLTLAWRNIVRNRRRSLLTGGILAFGFASFTLAAGFMAQSFQGLRDNTIRSGLGHLQFADARAFTQVEDAPLQFALINADPIIARLAQDPAVRVVLPRLEFVGLIAAKARSVPFVGLGVDPAAEKTGTDIPATIGSGAWLGGDKHAAVLGTGLARTLNVAVGDGVTLLATTPDGTLNAVDAVVAGLADIRFKELNDRYLAVPLTLAQELLDAAGSVSKISVVLHATGAEAETARRLSGALGGNLAVRTWEELAQFYNQVKTLYIGIFGFMGIVLMVVVLLAGINATLMTVTERTREIGTLRALGARPRVILTNFILEGAVLGAVASVAGALLSLVVSAVLNASAIEMPPPPGATRGIPINVVFFPLAYVGAALAMTCAAVVASYFPARRASRISIVAALAHV